jgi:cyanophycinase-like exopeptidase
MRPLYLFADSLLLFWAPQHRSYLASVLAPLERGALKAAYVGASNGDEPAFFELFAAAMHRVGVRDCRPIVSAFPPADRRFLAHADLVLLAGGEVQRGWEVMRAVGLAEAVLERHRSGGVVIGVSAGAVQLGRYGWGADAGEPGALFATFGLVPYVIGVHEEGERWRGLTRVVRRLGGSAIGIGIASGGGVVWHPEGRLEPIRFAAEEVRLEDGRTVTRRFLPARLDVE